MEKNLVLKESSDKLKSLIQKNINAMPKGFNQTRFLQNCLTVLSDTKDIEKCDPVSIARTMIKGAYLGLDFFNRECYAICYGGKLQFQSDYKGEVKLAKKYSINPIKDIYTKLVREGDVFEDRIVDGRQSINFKPLPFNDGKLIGAFAVAYFVDGSMIYETMSVKEMESTRRNYSKQANGNAWIKSTNEMYRKTVSRRLCKLISIDFDTSQQDKAFKDGADFDSNKIINTIDVEVKDPFAKDSTGEKSTNDEKTTNDVPESVEPLKTINKDVKPTKEELAAWGNDPKDNPSESKERFEVKK